MLVKLLQLVVGVSLCVLVIGVSEPMPDLLGPSCSLVIWDMVISMPDGSNHTEGCDFYKCVNGILESNIHPCENKLDYHERNLCRKWSDDDCCCEVVGCEDVHGNIQPKGAEYQTTLPDPTRPECGQFCDCAGGYHRCRIDSRCLRNDIIPLPDVDDVPTNV